MIESWQVVFRLLLAAVCGGIVGYQREIVDRPAGFRTHVLVCTGSALLMIISVYPFLGMRQVDLSRIAAAVVTGMGFLGAGTIIRQGSIVRGLTTAASLWTIAGVGLAIGTGFYFAALITTALVFVVLAKFKLIETRLFGTKGHKILNIKFVDRAGQLEKIDSLLAELKISIRSVEKVQEAEGLVRTRLLVDVPKAVSISRAVRGLMEIPGISEAGWEEY